MQQLQWTCRSVMHASVHCKQVLDHGRASLLVEMLLQIASRGC